MDDTLCISRSLAIPIDDVEIRASRSSGPGGQHANVTASRIEVSVDLRTCRGLDSRARERLIERFGPRVTAVAQDTRSQARNREIALDRLRSRLADALYERPARRPTRPSRAADARRLDGKRRQGERKRGRGSVEPD